ncbi:MAG: MFS transporter [Chloroflexota bacterium]
MNEYYQLLRKNPGYLRLWMAQAVSLLGDWFTTIALSTLVVRYSNGSGLAVSGLLLARFVPPFLVGPFAGVLVDRLNRKHLLIFSDVVRTFVALTFLLAKGPGQLWLIYALTIIQFSLSALFEPCRSALIPSLVGQEDLVPANTLGSVTWSVMLAAGAAIGGIVTAVLGTPTALIIDAATFACSALLIVTITPRAVAAASHTLPIHDANGLPLRLGDGRGFIDGLRYVAQHPATAAVMLVKAGGNIGNFDLLLVIYSTQMFVIGENGTGSLGILYAAFGAGAVLGPVVLNRFNDNSVRRMRRLIIVGYVWVASGWLLFGLAPTLLLAILAVLVKAAGSSIYWTYSSVILQKIVPDDFLGRVFALDQAGFQLAVSFSALITGWLIDRVGHAGGIQISTAMGLLQTGTLNYQAGSAEVRAIVLGTALISVIPLALWTVALPWMERQVTKETLA